MSAERKFVDFLSFSHSAPDRVQLLYKLNLIGFTQFELFASFESAFALSELQAQTPVAPRLETAHYETLIRRPNGPIEHPDLKVFFTIFRRLRNGKSDIFVNFRIRNAG